MDGEGDTVIAGRWPGARRRAALARSARSRACSTPAAYALGAAHVVTDSFGKSALRAAHDITEALADVGADDDGIVVLRTDGPRHSLAGLERLIDEALAEDDGPGDAPGVDVADGGERPPR